MNKGVQCVFTGRSRNRIAPIPELQQSGEDDDAVSVPCVNLGKGGSASQAIYRLQNTMRLALHVFSLLLWRTC